MAGRIICESKNYLQSYGGYLAEKIGIKPIPVEIAELLENPRRFYDEKIETTGFYLSEGDRKLLTDSKSTGLGGGAWGAAIYVPTFTVVERGRLFSSPFQPFPNIRVFMCKDYDTQQKAAEKDILRTREIQQQVLKGTVRMGFPGEYYIYSSTAPLRIED